MIQRGYDNVLIYYTVPFQKWGQQTKEPDKGDVSTAAKVESEKENSGRILHIAQERDIR
jgi:hypothetical protein